mmetsp:Transcript_5147/g.19287  ORF Transcript_5147/g.19287 Transcript_5147/m.19287 type:complete len:235 (+) Transcript_5147:1126-1830(+)
MSNLLYQMFSLIRVLRNSDRAILTLPRRRNKIERSNSNNKRDLPAPRQRVVEKVAHSTKAKTANLDMNRRRESAAKRLAEKRPFGLVYVRSVIVPMLIDVKWSASVRRESALSASAPRGYASNANVSPEVHQTHHHVEDRIIAMMFHHCHAEIGVRQAGREIIHHVVLVDTLHTIAWQKENVPMWIDLRMTEDMQSVRHAENLHLMEHHIIDEHLLEENTDDTHHLHLVGRHAR